MPRTSRRRCSVAVGVLSLAASLGVAAPAAADSARVPTVLQPPAGQQRVATQLGAGVQIYDCTAGTWTFREPAAVLLRKRRVVGIHYAGPTWQSLRDGSKVTGAVAVRQDAPRPTRDIPWLLLRSTSNTGSGVFGKVTYIQRIDTRGGVAPTGSCDAATTPSTAVRYTATYVFFAPR